jgi:hypothetical protein
MSLFGTITMKQLATHLAANVADRRQAHDTDSIITLRRFAVLVAIEKFGVDEDRAVAWLVEANFGDDVLNGIRSYYRNKLDQVRMAYVREGKAVSA